MSGFILQSSPSTRNTDKSVGALAGVKFWWPVFRRFARSLASTDLSENRATLAKASHLRFSMLSGDEERRSYTKHNISLEIGKARSEFEDAISHVCLSAG